MRAGSILLVLRSEHRIIQSCVGKMSDTHERGGKIPGVHRSSCDRKQLEVNKRGWEGVEVEEGRERP